MVITMLSCVSCGFLPRTMSQAINMPEFPEVWAEASNWELRWESDDGSSGTFAARPGSTVSLDLPIAGSALIFARALYGTKSTKPYGALWPQDLDVDGALRLSAEGGWCASMALPLMRWGWDLRCFNWDRLGDELSARLADPWEIDPASFCANVVEGEFRADYLRPPNIRLETPVSGIGQTLFPASPWGQVLVPDAVGDLRASVSPGSYSWMNGRSCLRMSVSASGEVNYTFSALP